MYQQIHTALLRPTSLLKVGVLMGGRSIEHEVSLNSGRTVCDYIDHQRFHAVPIFQTVEGKLYVLPPQFIHRGKTTDFVHRLATEARAINWDELPLLIDLAFCAMHGRYAEDGRLQGMLELFGIPYVGSGILASALSMDKALQRHWLQHHKIAIPLGMVLPPQTITLWEQCPDTSVVQTDLASLAPPQQLTQLLEQGLIIKPAHEGSSLGVRCVHTLHDLRTAAIHAAHISPGIIQSVVVEEKLSGMEFSCIVITDPLTNTLRALPATEIVPRGSFFTYDEKYMPGKGTKYTPARCSASVMEKIQRTCVATMHALDMHTYGRIDGFVTSTEEVIIIDPNSFIGIAPSSFTFWQAAEIGMSHTQFINHLIDTAVRHNNLVPALPSTHMTTHAPQTRVAVLMGGPSAEREVSLESGRNVTYKLSPHRYAVTPLFMSQDHRLYRIPQKLLVKNSTREITDQLAEAEPILWSELAQQFDFVFIALHGAPGENGVVQGALELLGLPYNGSGVATSALCMDKYKTTTLLRMHGHIVPRNLCIPNESSIRSDSLTALLAAHELSYPLIVKPHNDGCSTLVQKVDNDEELNEALQTIYRDNRPYALVEECIQGMELTVGALGNEQIHVFPPSYTVTQGSVLSIEEKFLPGAGENQTPAPLPPETIAYVQREIARVYATAGCIGYARIDCFYQNATVSPTGIERLVILEINTLPALTPATCLFHQAAEEHISPMELLDRIVQLGFASHTSHELPQRTSELHAPPCKNVYPSQIQRTSHNLI